MTTNRIHDLSSLREEIKINATRARELRQEARETSGLDRHYLKIEANDYGEQTRYPHLALGYLRGRTIEQMESKTTHPDNLPWADGILRIAKQVWLRGPDIDELEDTPAWEDFADQVKADLKTWHAGCRARHAMKLAIRRREAAKEADSEAA